MILVVPSAVITLMYFMLSERPTTRRADPFDTTCLILLGLFLLFIMFLITSITMQRERSSGTLLERIMTTPLRRFDLLAASRHGIFHRRSSPSRTGLRGVVLAAGFTTAGSAIWVFIIAILNAVLGVGLGLLASAFARTEFQAVQFMPVVIVQLLLAESSFPAARCPNGCTMGQQRHAGQLRPRSTAASEQARGPDRHRDQRHGGGTRIRGRSVGAGRGDAAQAHDVTNSDRKRPGRPAGSSDTRERFCPARENCLPATESTTLRSER